MGFVSLHPSQLVLRLTACPVCKPPVWQMPIWHSGDATETSEFSAVQVASNLTFPHLNLRLWFNLFQGTWQSEWNPVICMVTVVDIWTCLKPGPIFQFNNGAHGRNLTEASRYGHPVPQDHCVDVLLHPFLLSGQASFGNPWVRSFLNTFMRHSPFNCPR